MTQEKKLHIALKLCISPLIVAVLLLAVYAVKGVFPFGERIVSYYDMSQKYIPIYTHFCDALHGMKNVLYNENIVFGTSLGVSAPAYLYFPLNLFWIFVPRLMVARAISWFLMLILCVSAFGMTLSLYLRGRRNWIVMIAAGVLYATSGYAIQYYTNIFFLCVMTVFPLLIWALDRLLEEGRIGWYALLLMLAMLAPVQLVLCSVFYIILRSFLYIRSCSDPARRKIMICNLALGSIGGVLLACFALIPEAMELMGTSRLASTAESGLLSKFTAIHCKEELYFYNKLFMLYGSEIAIVAMGMMAVRKRIKENLSEIILWVFCVLPIFVESINMLLIGGSYRDFPMRAGFILGFQSMLVLDRFAVNLEEDTKVSEKVFRYLPYLSIPCLMVLLYWFNRRFTTYGMRTAYPYTYYWIAIVGMAMVYLVAFLFYRNKSGMIALCAAVVLQAGLGLYGFVAPTTESHFECTDEILEYGSSLYNNRERIMEGDGLLKDAYQRMNTDYALIADVPSMGGWVASSNQGRVQNSVKAMGYSAYMDRNLDSGGTAFTDALLHVNTVYSEDVALSEALYEPMTEAGYYRCKYTMPYGVVLDYDVVSSDEMNPFTYQNEIYKSLTGQNNLLIDVKCGADLQYDLRTTASAADLESEEDSEKVSSKEYVISLEGTAGKELYIFAEGGNKYEAMVDGVDVLVPYQSIKDNRKFPTEYMNGIIDCGYMKEDSAEVVITTRAENLKGITIGLMDVSVLDGACKIANDSQNLVVSQNGGKIQLSGSVNKDGILFLPLSYFKSREFKMNNSKVSATPLMGGGFTGIAVKSGTVVINGTYHQKGLLLGVVVSILSCICLLIVCLKRVNIEYTGWIRNVVYAVFQIATVAGVIVLYLIPIVFFIIYGIRDLI